MLRASGTLHPALSSPAAPLRTGWLALGLLLLAGALALRHLLPLPATDTLDWLILRDAMLPRIAIALLSGGALGLAGALFQQVLRNPLAEPSTLGISGGAYLALVLATLLAPGLVQASREGVALAGAALAALTVFGLAWRRGLAPMALVLAGLVISLYCGALIGGATLLGGGGIQSLFLWASGSLVQNGWGSAAYLAPRLVVGVVLAALLARPLRLLELGEQGAVGLGLKVVQLRLLALGLAVALSAAVVSAVGVIGFIGLAAPALARLTGARRLGQRLLWAPILGALLLLATDGAVQALGTAHEIPAGAATALLGAPLLFWLLPRLRAGVAPVATGAPRRLGHPWRWALAGLVLMAAAAFLSLTFGRGLTGFQWRDWAEAQPFLIWRAPRMAAALAAGAMLATAGAIIQRLTGNPMASPEVLGVSAGSALGVILLLLLLPGFDPQLMLAAATLGGAAVLAALLLFGHRGGHVPERMLLGGIALATILNGVIAAFLASGDPRSFFLLQWMSGTTWLVTPPVAMLSCGLAAVLILAALPCARWLTLLPLGEPAAKGLGLRLGAARGTLLLLAAALTAAATLVVGPLSFIGLMAPHMARMMGLSRALPQIIGAALVGGLVMVLADWLGRILLFPAQMPAGLIATLLCTPYLLWLMRRR